MNSSLREHVPHAERAPARLAVVWCHNWTTFAAGLRVAPHVAFEPVVRAVGDDVAGIEVVEPGLLVCDAGGAARRVGGTHRLVARLDAAIREALHGINTGIDIDMKVGIGVGEGRLAAALAARRSWESGKPCIIARGESVRFVQHGSVRSLLECAAVIGAASPLDPGVARRDGAETVGILERLGLYRWGDVAQLGEKALAMRFGGWGVELYRLATGRDRHIVLPVVPPADCARRLDCDTVLRSRDIVLNETERLVDDVLANLAARGWSCSRMSVVFDSDNDERSERTWYRAEGWTTRDVCRAVAVQLDAWIAAGAVSDGVRTIVVTPRDVGPLRGTQRTLWNDDERGGRAAGAAVARLSSMNGVHSVAVVRDRGGRDPAVRYDVVDLGGDVRLDAAVTHLDDARATSHWRGTLPSPLPAIVHRRRAPVIEVLDVDGADVGVDARHELTAAPHTVVVGGRRCDVVDWAGPWPLEERWWDALRARRLAYVQIVMCDADADDDRPVTAILAARMARAWHLVGRYA
jgi:protein ImuB